MGDANRHPERILEALNNIKNLLTKYFTSKTYTGTATEATTDVSPTLTKSYSLQIVGTGAAASAWTVVLEGSLDGTNFSTIISHTDSDGDGVVKFTGATMYPAKYFRTRCTALTKGSATNIIAYVVAE